MVHAMAVRRNVLDHELVLAKLAQDNVRFDLSLTHDVLVGLFDALALFLLLLLLVFLMMIIE